MCCSLAIDQAALGGSLGQLGRVLVLVLAFHRPQLGAQERPRRGMLPGLSQCCLLRPNDALFIGVRYSQWYIHLGACEHSICANACKRECREANGY